jgi:hypothetical protein
MPKRKPDQVIVYRLELQDTERAALEMAAAGYTFNRISDPLIRLINDNTSLVLILSLIAGYLGFKWIPPALEEGMEIITDFKDQLDAAVEQGTVARSAWNIYREGSIDPVVDAARRGPLWGFIDLAENVFNINLPDFGGGYEPGPGSTTGPDYYTTEAYDAWRDSQRP